MYVYSLSHPRNFQRRRDLCHEALRIRRHIGGAARHHAAAELASLDATCGFAEAQGETEIHDLYDKCIYIYIYT